MGKDELVGGTEREITLDEYLLEAFGPNLAGAILQ
jgi:hypothetical protein